MDSGCVAPCFYTCEALNWKGSYRVRISFFRPAACVEVEYHVMGYFSPLWIINDG